MLKYIAEKAFHAAGLDVRRTKGLPPAEPTVAGNQLVSDIWKAAGLHRFAPFAIDQRLSFQRHI